MAETVKKSRIVSETDENLEESLLEEFNLRLKQCMSRENLADDTYENVQMIKTNGITDGKPEIMDVFLKREREEAEVLNNGLKPHLELNGLKTEKLDLPVTCLIELPSPTEPDDPKTVKDRMLLSTDDVSCLLFTQTVTSPMLTPSEESIDFLKGFSEQTNPNESEPIYENVQLVDAKQATAKFLENETHTVNGTGENCCKITSGPDETVENYENIENCRIITGPDKNFEASNLPENCETVIENGQDLDETVEINEPLVENCEIITDSDEKNNETIDFANQQKNVETLKSQFLKENDSENANTIRTETNEELDELKSLNIMKQITRFESNSGKLQESTNACVATNISVSESHFIQQTITTTSDMVSTDDKSLKKKKTKKAKNHHHHEKENISVKSSFSKFDALQKKNVLNQTNEHEPEDHCKGCGKQVFQMERIVAERCIWHRNCFRCHECSKQLLVDNFESHEGTLYCKPHFKALFAPKAVEDGHPTSDKPDLGLEELHSLNVKERFQVFENAQATTNSQFEKGPIKMERSPSILSKLARFQAKGMDVGVTDESLNGIPITLSESDEETEPVEEEEDAELVRAKRVQKEKPFHFSQMSDVKSKWEQGGTQNKDERREERKQEIQNIRSRLFLGKQGKMKEAYQQAIAESESQSNLKREVPVEPSEAAKSIKDKFEKGEVARNEFRNKEAEDMSVFESAISKNSRSLFQELDATSGRAPKITSPTPPKLGTSVRNAREAYVARQAQQDTVKSSDEIDEIHVRTADIQDRFKFFESYREPQHERREFRMTPPREGQTKSKTPERDDGPPANIDIVRSDETIEDSVVAKATHTTTKMLSKFRQMEENLIKQNEPLTGLKPLKRFTPPREPARKESSSERDSGSEEEENSEDEDEMDNVRVPEQDLIEAQKAACAKKLRAKFERWEANEIKRDSSVNLAEEIGEDQSQVETARSLRAKFESLRETTTQKQAQRVKVNRFV